MTETKVLEKEVKKHDKKFTLISLGIITFFVLVIIYLLYCGGYLLTFIPPNLVGIIATLICLKEHKASVKWQKAKIKQLKEYDERIII